MSRECQTELETGVAKRWDVEVMPGKANLEVRPTFINKGEIAKRLVRMYNDPTSDEFAGTVAEGTNHGQLQFVLCMGDDFTDEDMFRALGGLSVVPENPHLKPAAGAGKGSATDSSNNDGLSANHVFSVTVGPSTKPTLARWHLLEPADVIECVALLAGVAGDADPTSTTASSTNGAYANGKVSNRDEEEELSSAATTNASRPAERRLGEVNLGVLSAAEGRIPQDQKEVGMDV